jgi:hypothetical protein
MYEGALAAAQPRPFIHNHVVDLKGPGIASGRRYVELRSFARAMQVASDYHRERASACAEVFALGRALSLQEGRENYRKAKPEHENHEPAR